MLLNTLYLAWQNDPQAADPRQRAWYPIGRLDRADSLYRFCYTRGVQQAQRDAHFHPLMAFPELDREYRSEQLFPLFQNRIINPNREDLSDQLQRLGLSSEDRDPFKILSVSGGRRGTDHLEVFPKIEKDPAGGFSCRFFAHGVRHLHALHRERLERLRADEPLRVSIELNNPVTDQAIQLMTDDYFLAGWAPRYLIHDLLRAMADHPRLTARVVRTNPAPAPLNQRLLIELSGVLPQGYQPMSGEEFQPLVQLGCA